MIRVNRKARYTALVSAPSITRLVPEMRLATGLARNTTPAATSCGVPIRPVGLSDIAGLEQIGHPLLDILPDPALEIGIARRHRVDADALRNELAAQPLGVVNQGRLEGAVGTGGEIDLEAGHA